MIIYFQRGRNFLEFYKVLCLKILERRGQGREKKLNLRVKIIGHRKSFVPRYAFQLLNSFFQIVPSFLIPYFRRTSKETGKEVVRDGRCSHVESLGYFEDLVFCEMENHRMV